MPASLPCAKVQNAFALQCVFDASRVRTAFALATPLVPLAVVAVCMCLELFRRGLGAEDATSTAAQHSSFLFFFSGCVNFKLPVTLARGACCLELALTSGISMSLKALAILFVGGASGAAELLECQHSDGEGRIAHRVLNLSSRRSLQEKPFQTTWPFDRSSRT